MKTLNREIKKEAMNKEEETMIRNKSFVEYKEDRKNMNKTVVNNIRKAAVTACAVSMLTACGNKNEEVKIENEDITSSAVVKEDTVIINENDNGNDSNETPADTGNVSVKDDNALEEEKAETVETANIDPYVTELERLKALLAGAAADLVLKQTNYDLSKEEYMSALNKVSSLTGNSAVTMSYEEATNKVNGTIDSLKKEYDASILELEKAKEDYEEIIRSLKEEYDFKDAALKALKEEAISDAKSIFDTLSLKAQEDYDSIVDAAQKEYDDAIVNAQSDYEYSRRDIEEVYTLALENIKGRYEELSEANTADLNREKQAALKARNEALALAKDIMDEEVEKARYIFDNATVMAMEALECAKQDATIAYNEALKKAEDAFNESTLSLEKNEAYIAAKEELSALLKEHDDALKLKEEADNNLDTARNELSIALEAKNAKEEEAQSIRDDIALKEKELLDIKAELESYNTQKDVLEADYKAQNDTLAMLNSLAEEKALELESAKEELNEANKALEDSDTVISNARKALEEAEAAYNASLAQIAKGSIGFFETMIETDETAREAIDLLNDPASMKYIENFPDIDQYVNATEIGNPNDATSLDNMKHSIELILEGNVRRVNDENFTGREALRINNVLMAQGQLNANVNSEYLNHTYVGDRNGENAAWGYYNAQEGWYDEEKAVYNYLKEYLNTEDSTTIANWCSGATDDQKKEVAAEVFGNSRFYNHVQIGHYRNLMSENYISTGIGSSTYLDRAYYRADVQEFYARYGAGKNDVTYDAEEYYANFMNYYNSVLEAKENALKALEEAKSNLESLEANGGTDTEALKAIESAENKVSSIESSIDSLNSQKEDILVSIEEISKELESVKEDIEEVSRKLDEESSSVEEYYSALDEKMEEVSACDNNVNSKKETVMEAEEVLCSREEELSDINLSVSAKQEEIETIVNSLEEENKEALDEYNNALSDAKKEYDAALEEADGIYEEAVKEDEDTMNNTINEAESKYNDKASEIEESYIEETNRLESDYNSKEEDYEKSKQEALNEAEVVKEEALNEAKEAFDEINNPLLEELDSKKDAALDEYDSTLEEVTSDYNDVVNEAEANYEKEAKLNSDSLSLEESKAKEELDAALKANEEALAFLNEATQVKEELDGSYEDMNRAKEELDAAEKAKQDVENSITELEGPVLYVYEDGSVKLTGLY